MAVWDAVAKIAEKPLFQLLAERYGDGQVNQKIFVYAAGGYYYPGKDDSQLKDEMRSYLDRGYSVVKMKIGGASLDEDLRRIDSVLSVLQDGQKLAVDANGRFDLDAAIAYAKALSAYDLFWYEEAGDPLDYDLQAALAPHYAPPMATGENLFSMQDARNLIRYGGMRPDTVIEWDNLAAVVEGHYAATDRGTAAPEAVKELEATLRAKGKNATFHVYPGTQHAFFNDTRPEVYDAAVAKTAWDRTLALFRANL
mgnify:CR=1 FL=1